MFYKDTAGKMDVADPTLEVNNANLGFKTRYGFSKEIKVELLKWLGQHFVTYLCPNAFY